MTINVNSQVNLSGKVKTSLVDTRTGKREVVSHGSNMILGSFLNRFFTHGSPLMYTSENLINSVLYQCQIGNGNVPVSIGDTGLSGSMLASSNVAYSQIHSMFTPSSSFSAGWAFNNKYDLLCLAAQDELQGPCMLKRLPNGRYKRIHFPLFGSSMGIDAVAFTHDGNYLLVAGNFPGRVIKYKVEDVEGEIVFTQEPPITGIPDYQMNYIIISPDDRFAFVAGIQGRIVSIPLYIDNPEAYVLSVPGSSPMQTQLTLAPDGSHFIHSVISGTSSSPRRIDILPDGTLVDGGVFMSRPTGYCFTAFSPSGNYLVLTQSSNVNRVYTYDDGVYTLLHSSFPGITTYLRNIIFVDDTKFYGTASGKIYGYEISLEGVQLICEVDYPGNLVGFNDKYQELLLSGSPISNEVYKVALDDGLIPMPFQLERAVDTGIFTSRKWIFPAGVGTGTIREAFVQSNNFLSGSALPATPVARKVFDLPIEKTEFHQLEVEWTIEASLPQVSVGVISGGQVDGVTDITWKAEVAQTQLRYLCQAPSIRFGSSTHYRNPIYRLAARAEYSSADWGALTIVGSSNLPGNLEFDDINTIYGSEMLNQLMVMEEVPYVTDSFRQRFRLMLEVDQANGEIGEILIRHLGRLTFDPPLQKSSNYRLYIDFMFALSQGGG
ncbi:MAG TPA: WD40 repeat domain-containing protein [Fervidobacterium sp.]|nr:WD40 repeat domain-containing protein [Fervidobacterium sp.]